MLKIDQVSIWNYKNLIVEELELKNFNVIVGPNNSGKSNFIQIFSFLNYIINGSVDQVKNDFNSGYFAGFGRIIPSSNESPNGEIKISLRFSDTNTDFQYHFQINLDWKGTTQNSWERQISIKSEEFDYKEIHKTGPPINIFKRTSDKVIFSKTLRRNIGIDSLPIDVSVINLLKVVSQSSRNQNITDALLALDLVLKTETIYFSNLELSKSEKNRTNKYGGRTVAFDLIKEIFNLSKKEDTFSYFKETLKNILKIDDVAVYEFKPDDQKDESAKVEYFIIFRHFDSAKILWDFSDGTILIIALITKILITDSDIYLIEEPENSLHPQALIDLINFFRSYEEAKQFIIASHSIAVINKVKPEDTIIAQCKENGLSQLKRVENSTELKKTLKQGFIEFSDLLFFNPNDID
jgi:predicted ATPase